ncbi:MAG: hypothetical protein D4R65_05020 [Verrucomicrobiaceae bacterium]|nr:MAG: hypothetical protein D4R65_05020 [Verrucomicrobiaceae bacterium]
MIERLERHLSRFAIPGLIRYVVALNALVFLLVHLNPDYAQVLALDRGEILHGEIWRLVSWIFLPDTQSLFWIIFYLLFTWWLGDLLEQSWGAFRLNSYYFLGMALCIASALIFGASGGNLFLNLSLFLAVATLAPDLEILLFFILPVKIKWVALFSLIFPAGVLLFGPLAAKMVVVMCLGNYLLFFAPAYFRGALAGQKTRVRRSRFEAAKLPASEPLHRCAACGATDHSHPDAEFRVTANGTEYCTSHLPGRTTDSTGAPAGG